MQFEELHQKQSQWTVPDTELRESLRLAVAEVLLPAYRSFVKRFGYVFFLLLPYLEMYMLIVVPTVGFSFRFSILLIQIYRVNLLLLESYNSYYSIRVIQFSYSS